MYRYSPSEMVCLDEKYLPKIGQKIFHQNESDQIIQELFCVDVCDRPGLHGLCMCVCVQQAQPTWIVYVWVCATGPAYMDCVCVGVCDRPSLHGLCMCVCDRPSLHGLCMCVCDRPSLHGLCMCVCDRPSLHGLCVCVTGPVYMDCVCV